MRTIILTIVALLCASTLAAQSEWAWELGTGGAVYQFNRIGDIRLTSSSEGHAVDISLRHVVYAGNLHVARELSNSFALDFQGSLGKIEKEWLTHLGLGLEWKLGHYFRSSLIDPYLRVGAGYMYKGHHILYSGERGETRWTMFNDHNKDGGDAQHITPLTAGAGINMWLGNRVGIGIQGDYVYMPKRNVANSLQGTVRLLLRLGGKPRRPQSDCRGHR